MPLIDDIAARFAVDELQIACEGGVAWRLLWGPGFEDDRVVEVQECPDGARWVATRLKARDGKGPRARALEGVLYDVAWERVEARLRDLVPGSFTGGKCEPSPFLVVLEWKQGDAHVTITRRCDWEGAEALLVAVAPLAKLGLGGPGRVEMLEEYVAVETAPAP